MNYNLNQIGAQQGQKTSTLATLRKLLNLIQEEKRNITFAIISILINSTLNLLGPFLIGYTIDHYIQKGDYHGVLVMGSILLSMYLGGLATSYVQTRLIAGVGQRLLFILRNALFKKIQELPVAFFNQNKAGDLISRVNNDTDKLNQFFSQSLVQFVSSIFTMIGAGAFLISINWQLGLATLIPAFLLLIFTRIISPLVKKKNAANMKSVGGMSAEIQESLSNFKVIVAFNRRDYFRKRFDEANQGNYTSAISAGLINNIFTPVYGLCASVAQLIILGYGIYLIQHGSFTIGLLVSYFAYATNFYNPVRQLAALWANFQIAMAGWDRISHILNLESNLKTIDAPVDGSSSALLEFRNVSFGYPDGKEVLHDINFQLDKGKTYALVGPTGGGKTTTASLLARLYDPTQGTVYLDGKDIRTYTPEERTQKVGFILQEPFLFTGTVRENILYGNEQYKNYSNEQLAAVIEASHLGSLLERFEEGLESKVLSSGDAISLGQKQLIAFMRAVLRDPELLILDEATANIDTVTEQLLDDILKRLPKSTTQVIIAHRLNTIENADEIYFVNSGEVTRAGSLDDAVNMLLNGKRES